MFRRYGFFGVVKLIFSLLYTKFFFSQARLIRLPFDIRNKRFVKIGKGLTTGFGCRIEALEIEGSSKPEIHIGLNVQINDYVHIAAGESVVIGDNVLIASKVFISDINHGSYSGDNADSPNSVPNDRTLSTRPVDIGENVWIGENVCIMPGTTIGRGSIIGASSVVTKNIPANCIAVGNPAKIIKKYNFDNNNWERID